jgi:hypothetical protein
MICARSQLFGVMSFIVAKCTWMLRFTGSLPILHTRQASMCHIFAL